MTYSIFREFHIERDLSYRISVRDAFQIKKNKTVELRTLSQVRSTHPPYPLLGTPVFGEIVSVDPPTHKLFGNFCEKIRNFEH